MNPENLNRNVQEDPFAYARRITEYITEKYAEVKITQDARRDALYYAAADLEMNRQAVTTTDTDPDETELIEKEINLWELAISDSKTGNWRNMKERLEDHASSALASANQTGDMEDKRRGEALHNLSELI